MIGSVFIWAGWAEQPLFYCWSPLSHYLVCWQAQFFLFSNESALFAYSYRIKAALHAVHKVVQQAIENVKPTAAINMG